MKNVIRALAVLAVVSSIVPFANAAGNPKCKDCGMVLASKKDAKHSVAVKIGKKTYYCCAGCAMNKKPAGKPTPHKTPTPAKTGG